MPMTAQIPTGLEYVAARLHVRRAALAEAARLDALCRIRTISELGRALWPDAATDSAIELQRRMVGDLVSECLWLRRLLEGPTGDLLEWVGVRFQMENLKVLARGMAAGARWDEVQPYLMPLPGDLAVEAQALASAESVEAFAALVPRPSLQRAVEAVRDVFRSQPQAFFIEAALDQAYFVELLARTAALPDEDRLAVLPVVRQEVDAFHLALVTRGSLLYGMRPKLLAPFHVGGAGIRRVRLVAMLVAGNLADVAAKAVGLAIDELPHELSGQAGLRPGGAGLRPGEAGLAGAMDPSLLEVMARNRFLRLANRAFRRSHMGPGAVFGYTAIRRVELANLITLTEGIRVGLRPEAIRARLIPQAVSTASKTDAQVSHA